MLQDAHLIYEEEKMAGYMEHLDEDVQAAIIRLNDALCSWERATSRESVLIIREQGGFIHRSMSGKPDVADDVSDEQLLAMISD